MSPDENNAPAAPTLKSKVLRGGGWLLVGNGAERGLRFLRMAALARLLAPADFGLMGLVTLALGFLEAFSFTATNQAIIQHPAGRSRNFLNTVFTITVVRGVILGAIIFLAAPWVAMFFKELALTGMIRLAAITPIVMGLMNPAVQVLLKDLNFRRWSIYRVVSGVLSVSVTILLGLWLRNAWALVIGSIGEQFFLVGLSYVVCSYRPVPTWNRDIGRELISLCRRAFGIPLILMLCFQAPSLLLGKLADMAALGAFLLTLNLADLPTYIVTRVVGTLALPAYSSIGDDAARLRRAWLQTIWWLGAVMLPAMLVMVFGAEVILRVAYGPGYAAQANVLRLLCIYSVMRFVVITTSSLMWAIGRPEIDRLSYLACVLTIFPLGALLVLRLGAIGMAVAIVAGWSLAAVIQLVAGARYFARVMPGKHLPAGRDDPDLDDSEVAVASRCPLRS